MTKNRIKGRRLFLVGVGPGSSKYLTDVVKEVIKKSKYLIGYKYSLSIIRDLIIPNFHQVYEVTMKDQDKTYKHVYKKMRENEFCTIPFTGDVNFSESEVVDRLLQIFGNDKVELIPGISSIQVAASRTKIPLDKARVFSFHVTDDIEDKKRELAEAIQDKKSVVLVPRPWNNNTEKNFMPSEIALYLKSEGIDTSNILVWVFEFLTTFEERVFRGKLSELENKGFGPMSVMVIDRVIRKTYLEFD
ncbi:MAG TPA: precorrin-6y C5,15-methyltransferase (decarboxylating) subunit CbiE [Nitrososphaeraceae archaeon]|nr:precorrin-6y C5,15-methyltransferase (decarboxylating) subunit CbiE [Nitrososphaeraceae archaeon]